MRLFVAIEVSEDVRARIGERIAALRRPGDGWKWVRPETVHLTLRFLGEVEGGRAAELGGGIRAALAGECGCTFRVAGGGAFPNARRPRVLWFGIVGVRPDGSLDRLATSVERAVRELGFDPEPRPFRAHLTVARARRDARPAPPTDLADEHDLGEVSVGRIVLMRSELSASGARYEVVDRFPLAPAAGNP